ncbi:MAG TPA: hypothetical protein VLQ65_02270 [Saliniramus sp.]|nr:hypothetical protein [Saliniramus sp.]
MKIISLLNVALAVSFALVGPIPAFAQTEQSATTEELPDGDLDQDALVKVSFGAVMMQVPVRLALQLCPGTDPQELARASMVAEGVACVIPQESYASQPAAEAGDR